MNKAKLNQKLQASETALCLAIAENRTMQERILITIRERDAARKELATLKDASQ